MFFNEVTLYNFTSVCELRTTRTALGICASSQKDIRGIDKAANHDKSAFDIFILIYIGQPDPRFHENTADPDSTRCDFRSRGSEPRSVSPDPGPL